MTEHFIPPTEENNVEQDAVFRSTLIDTGTAAPVAETTHVQRVISAPKIIDPAFLGEDDRKNFDKLTLKALRAETAHYRELEATIPNMARQAVLSAALADDPEAHKLIAVNYLGRVENLANVMSPSEKEEITRQAVEALSQLPNESEIIATQKADLALAETLLQQKTAELQYLKDLLKPEITVLIERIVAIDDKDDPERKELEERLDALNILIGYNSHLKPLPTHRPATTDELEQSYVPSAPETSSPPRGIEIGRILAKRALGGVKKGAKKLWEKSILDESLLDEPLSQTRAIDAELVAVSK